jgi:hypothetical protein
LRTRALLALTLLFASREAAAEEVSAGATATGPTPTPAVATGDTFAAPNGQLGAGLSTSAAQGLRMYGELGFYTTGDTQSFAGAEFSTRIWSVSAIVGGGYKIAPDLEIEAMLPLAFVHATASIEGPGIPSESDSETEVAVGNLHLGASYVRGDGPLRMKIGGALEYGLWTIDPSDEFAITLYYAAFTRGGHDIGLWSPEVLSIVTPARFEMDVAEQVVVTGDGQLGVHIPTNGNDVEMSIHLAPGIGFWASQTFLLGARLPFTWFPTETGSFSTLLSFEPFMRFDVSDSAFLNARFTLNIDEPLGFSFDEGKYWGLHFGGGGRF